ncbi:hypothetical protein QYR60_05830 [Streptococcus iniae]|nr:hypothetical protein QYR60_05830 [Streptococcus iniae]
MGMYKGKRFLLTHIWLRGFSGAEINILELATYLKKEGAKVEVFTFLASSPMIEEFQKRDISVIDDINYPFDINCYDVIFSAQNIIPSAIVNALGKKQEKCPKFIFIHMAALKEHVLEQPYIYGLEEKLSSATLAISEEIVQKNLKRFLREFLIYSTIPIRFLKNTRFKCMSRKQLQNRYWSYQIIHLKKLWA